MAISQETRTSYETRFKNVPLKLNGINGHVNDVNAHVNGNMRKGDVVTQGSYDPIDITMHNVTAWTPRKKLRLVTVGAGFSRLLFAHKLQHEFSEMQDLVEHAIYEAREDIGGTWLCNRYPGVQCDVPAHIYSFPFNPNTDWTHFYSSGPEIHAYIKKTTEKWKLDRDVHLRHRVLQAIWQEDLGKWEITVQSPERSWTEHADVLISGQAVLNTWKWPEIEGLHDFKGRFCHSASWDPDYDYFNKKIAVIGNGSSGIQIIPQLAKLPGTEVLSFQ